MQHEPPVIEQDTKRFYVSHLKLIRAMCLVHLLQPRVQPEAAGSELALPQRRSVPVEHIEHKQNSSLLVEDRLQGGKPGRIWRSTGNWRHELHQFRAVLVADSHPTTMGKHQTGLALRTRKDHPAALFIASIRAQIRRNFQQPLQGRKVYDGGYTASSSVSPFVTVQACCAPLDERTGQQDASFPREYDEYGPIDAPVPSVTRPPLQQGQSNHSFFHHRQYILKKNVNTSRLNPQSNARELSMTVSAAACSRSDRLCCNLASRFAACSRNNFPRLSSCEGSRARPLIPRKRSAKMPGTDAINRTITQFSTNDSDKRTMTTMKRLNESFPKWEKRVMKGLHDKQDEDEVQDAPWCAFERHSLSSLGEWSDSEDEDDLHGLLAGLEDVLSSLDDESCQFSSEDGENFLRSTPWWEEEVDEGAFRSLQVDAFPELQAPRLRRQRTISSFLNCNVQCNEPPRLPEAPFLVESTSVRCEAKPKHLFRILKNAVEQGLDADVVEDAAAFKLRALWNGGQEADTVMFVARVFREAMPLSGSAVQMRVEFQQRSGDRVGFFTAVQRVTRALQEASGVKVTFTGEQGCPQRSLAALQVNADSVEPLLDLLVHETDDTIRLQAAHSVRKTIVRSSHLPASFWSEAGPLSSLLTLLEQSGDVSSEFRAAIAASISAIMGRSDSKTPTSALQASTDRLGRLVQQATEQPWSATAPNWLAGLGGRNVAGAVPWTAQLDGSLERRVLCECTRALATGLLQLGVAASKGTMQDARKCIQRIRGSPDQRIATAAQQAARALGTAA